MDSQTEAELRGLITELERERDELQRGYDARGSTLQHMGHAVERMEAAESRLAELQQAKEAAEADCIRHVETKAMFYDLLREAMGALEPFAAWARTIDDAADDGGDPPSPDNKSVLVRLGECRRVRSAHAKLKAVIAQGGEDGDT